MKTRVESIARAAHWGMRSSAMKARDIPAEA